MNVETCDECRYNRAGRCQDRAVYGRDGGVYAEAHHKEQLSELAPDAPSNMICVCPTCHRVLHYGSVESLAERRALAVERKA